MIPRWNSNLNNLKLFLYSLDKVLPFIKRKKQRGRPPKHSIRKYLKLIIAKEYKKCSLRDAEHDLSGKVCKTRVDHSVIAYWERKFSKEFVEDLIKKIGGRIAPLLAPIFIFLDSTKFTTWNKKQIELHVLAKTGKGVLLPVSVCFSGFLKRIAKKIFVRGNNEFLLADAWYDSNEIFRQAFKSSYLPLIKPNKDRLKGYWRRKARKLWNKIENRIFYRNRGIGESIFGSLTNWFGDRLKTRRIDTTITRIGARIIAYQVKVCMRLKNLLILFNFLLNF